MQFTHNADHPLEDEVARVVRRYFENMNWPFERLPIGIDFKARTTASDSRIVDYELRDVLLHGKVRIYFNFIFLLQNESAFIRHIVPHEVAHVFAQAESYRRGITIKEHGPEWQKWLATISADAIQAAKGPGDIFDDRSIRLFKGGTPIRCSCPGNDGYKVIAQSSEARLSEVVCPKCEVGYAKTGRDDAPPEVMCFYEYLANETSVRSDI
jgi:predicted SprT family Zn-dependent metalloprotease